MKIIISILAIFLMHIACYSQELVSKGGITVSYEASKTETTKKADKWKLKVTINNTTGTDLYFIATSGVSTIALDAPYLRIDIPNAKGLLALNVKYYRGKMVDGVLSADKRAIYKIPAGILEETLETTVAIGDTPIVKGTVTVEPLTYEVITGAVPAATAQASASAAPAATDDGQTEVMVFTRASIPSGQKLQLNEAIEMPAAPENRLTLDQKGNLLLSNDGGKTSVWTSDTAGKQVSYAEMEADGNFVLKTAAGNEVWSTNTGGNPGAMIMLGQGGTVAIFSKEFKSLWQAP